MAEKEFTATEVMMLQERLEKGITVIAEQLGDIKTDVRELKDRMGHVEEDLTIIKASLPIKVNKSEFETIERRVEVLEAKPA